MPRNLQELRERIRNEQNNLDQLRVQNRALADDPNATAAQIEAALENTRALDARIRIMRDDLEAEERRRGATDMQPANAQDSRDASRSERLHTLLASREYARAFAAAIAGGLNIRTGRSIEQLRPLYDALTETGGTPEGSQGGFLVPEDIDHTIRETRRSLVSLATLFDTQTVTTRSGARTKDTAPTAGFTKLTGEATPNAVPEDDQPAFAQVPYTLDTYGLNIPISNELAADEVAGLFTYLGRYFARKQVITENRLLLGLLDNLTAVSFTPSATKTAMNELKRILNVVLDPDISLNAAIITNQSGYDYLDQLEDKDGRPLLQPDPTSGTPMLFKSKRVMMVSDAHLANPAGGLPFYVGDFTQYGTLFVRNPLEIASTVEGGNAWHSYSTEVRGIVRMSASVFDSAAASRLQVKTSA
jgi:HK97 family phage major capsid protein